MSVTSWQFFAFLAATLILISVAPEGWRKWVLIGASIVFYTSTGLVPTLIVGAVIAINFAMLCGVIKARTEQSRDRIYLGSMLFNALLFCAMKLSFDTAPGVPAISLHFAGLALGYPLGLSFILPMLHSAITDAHSGKFIPRLRFPDFLLFSTFFSYVSAGPIERLERMEAPLAAPLRPTLADVREGLSLIALGLIKKIVVANRLHIYTDAVFAGDVPNSSPTLILAIILNAAYVYSDFSGYTDIARGAARCLGIDILINFNKPFSSTSMTEFWRRWHISFSNWLRDYIYMPLAFTWRRSGRSGQSAALLLTFVICGFWHRATWTFVLFGVSHGLALAAETRFAPIIKAPAGRWGRRLWAGAAHFYLISFVCLTEVLFSATSVAQAGSIYQRALVNTQATTLADLMAYKGPVLFAFMFAGIAAWQIMERWQRRLTPDSAPFFVATAALLLIFMGQPDGGGFVYVQF